MGQVALRFPGDLRQEQERERRYGRHHPVLGYPPCGGERQQVGRREQNVLEQGQGEYALPEHGEHDRRQPSVQRRLRAVAPGQLLRHQNLFRLVLTEIRRNEHADEDVCHEVGAEKPGKGSRHLLEPLPSGHF